MYIKFKFFFQSAYSNFKYDALMLVTFFNDIALREATRNVFS